jgi:hypothetical protein
MTSFNKYKKALEKRNSVLKKQNAIYHNAFMEINLLLCQDFSAEQRLKNIISVVQVSRDRCCYDSTYFDGRFGLSNGYFL